MKRSLNLVLSGLLVASLSFGLAGCRTHGATADVEEFATEDVAYEMADAYAGTAEEYIDFNTEEYAAIRESGFIAVATRPLSTFSSDVDTASYCNLRRMLNQGYYPGEIDSGAVRIEEMLNYFHYDYATPTGDDLFGVTVQLGDCPWNPDTKLLVMGFATAPEPRTIAGRNLVFLIDSSGSMDSADKLPLLKDTFSALVEKLDANDRISIVTYSGSEEVLAQGVPGDDSRTIMQAIRSIRADGCTNGEAGLEMAYRLAEENYIEGGVNRIILASDGDLNVGMTSESDLNDYVSAKRETGIYLSVLGFGSGNYKDNKMETLADNGNGSYHYIDCEEEALRVFGENLTANLEPLADDVKLQVEFNPAQVKAYRLIGYENRAMEDAEFNDETADAADIGPSSQFTVAYEIVTVDSAFDVPGIDLKYDTDEVAAAANASDEWLTCTMRYKPITGGAAEQQVVVSSADFSDDPGRDWAFAASVIEFGMLLRGSEYAGSATYDSVIALATASAADDDLRWEFVDLVETAAGNDIAVIEDVIDAEDDGRDVYLD